MQPCSVQDTAHLTACAPDTGGRCLQSMSDMQLFSEGSAGAAARVQAVLRAAKGAVRPELLNAAAQAAAAVLPMQALPEAASPDKPRSRPASALAQVCSTAVCCLLHVFTVQGTRPATTMSASHIRSRQTCKPCCVAQCAQAGNHTETVAASQPLSPSRHMLQSGLPWSFVLPA